MKTILITTSTFGSYDTRAIYQLRDAGFKIVRNPFKRKLTENEVRELVVKNNPVGIIAGVEPLTKNVMEAAHDIKVISRCGIGMDAVDLKAAEEKGIVVRNTPDAPTIPVAELTLGMILGLLRRITIADRGVKNGKWQRPMGNLLHKKTVGIIGCGRIGTYLGTLLTAFECNLLGYDIKAVYNTNFNMVSKKQLLNESDIVSLHLPYTADSHYFIDIDEICEMKNSAIIVNAARGGLVNEKVLYDSLVKGDISGAALDCFESEPYNGRLIELDNVLLTSHIGSYAIEGRNNMEQQAVENLLDALQE